VLVAALASTCPMRFSMQCGPIAKLVALAAGHQHSKIRVLAVQVSAVDARVFSV
jgi:hypothetical protein